MTKISPSVVSLIGESNLSEVSHATIELKVTGTSAEVQRAVKHIAGSKGRKTLAKMAKKEVKDDADDGSESESEGRPYSRSKEAEMDAREKDSLPVREGISPKKFATRLLDGA